MTGQKGMKNNFKEFSLYLAVGVIATLTEWLVFFLLNKVAVYYILATVIAYMVSTFVNWLIGRWLVFKERTRSVIKELAGVYLASVIGLLANAFLMWLAVEILSFNKMPSKIAATIIVFAYNFLVRKFIIYKGK